MEGQPKEGSSQPRISRQFLFNPLQGSHPAIDMEPDRERNANSRIRTRTAQERGRARAHRNPRRPLCACASRSQPPGDRGAAQAPVPARLHGRWIRTRIPTGALQLLKGKSWFFPGWHWTILGPGCFLVCPQTRSINSVCDSEGRLVEAHGGLHLANLRCESQMG